jgi:uncharacterized membrane protein YhhN
VFGSIRRAPDRLLDSAAMRGVGWALIGVTLVVAGADWAAVARGNRRAEAVLKPLTMVVLIAAAIVLRDNAPAFLWWAVVAALVLSLAGDVLLFLPDRFVEGVAAFLFAHVAYIAAFVSSGLRAIAVLGGALVVGAVSTALYARILRGLREHRAGSLAVPLSGYVLALSGTVIAAIGTVGAPDWALPRSLLAVSGAALFYASDAMIGWTRFVHDVRGGRVAIMVTYHVGQIALVLALLG